MTLNRLGGFLRIDRTPLAGFLQSAQEKRHDQTQRGDLQTEIGEILHQQNDDSDEGACRDAATTNAKPFGAYKPTERREREYSGSPYEFYSLHDFGEVRGHSIGAFSICVICGHLRHLRRRPARDSQSASARGGTRA